MNLQPLFESYASSASLIGADGATLAKTKAFVSPLRYKNKMYLYGVNTEIGYNSQGHYLYIGPPTPDLTEAPDGSYIFAIGKKFRVDRAEKVFKGDEAFYIWAVVREIVEIE